MKCPVCGGPMKDAIVNFCSCEAERHATLVEDVPARVCGQCGEQWFSEQTLERLKLAQDSKVARPYRSVSLYVYNYDTMDADSQSPATAEPGILVAAGFTIPSGSVTTLTYGTAAPSRP